MSDELAVRNTPGVTSVIRHTVKPGAEEEYEAWLKELAAFGRNFPGHQGANIIRPGEGSTVYTIILRFDTVEHMQEYLSSEVRRKMVNNVKPLLARKVEVNMQTGLDFWFTPPTADEYEIAISKPVKPYKQFLVVLSAIFPLTILIHNLVLIPLSDAFPFLRDLYLRELLDALIVVATLTFLIMPHYTRLLAKWLYD